jgi:hypothetical protein
MPLRVGASIPLVDANTCSQQLSIRWSAFVCPIAGSIAWRRLSQRRCSVVKLLNLPRRMICTPGLCSSTPR